MSSASHDARQTRPTTFQWVVGLSLLIGFGASAIVLFILFNATPASTESSSVLAGEHSLESGAPSSGPSDQAVQAVTDEAPESTATTTPEAVPSNTPDIPEASVEPTPESDSATATAEPAPAAATATPEPEPSGSEVQDNAEPIPNEPSATPVPRSNPQKMRIEIPAIGVNAPVEVKSIDGNGVMQNPSSPDAVAWYDFTSRPEGHGNAVFAGHLDFAGVGPAVFWELGSLKPGDEVNVALEDGNVVRYRITDVRSVHADADASDIVAKGDVAKITIITCDGSFDPTVQEYDQRIVVTGERVG